MTKFEKQKYYRNKPRFNRVYSRDNLSENIKDRAYIINLDEYANVGTHWIVLHVSNNSVIYFERSEVKHIPKNIKKGIGNKNIKTDIFRIDANSSILCGYFCVGFIDFMHGGKILTDYTSLFSSYNFEKNDKIILSYFKNEWPLYYKFKFKWSDTI